MYYPMGPGGAALFAILEAIVGVKGFLVMPLASVLAHKLRNMDGSDPLCCA